MSKHTVSNQRRRHSLSDLHATVVIAAAVAVAALISRGNATPRGTLFARQNLIAWCVIPFDSMHRTPLELAQMLKRLGIERLGLDWRAKDIPHFDEEIDTLRKNHIIIQSFWLRGNMYPNGR